MKEEFKALVNKSVLLQNIKYPLVLVFECKILMVAPKANFVKVLYLSGNMEWINPDEYSIVDVLEDQENAKS